MADGKILEDDPKRIGPFHTVHDLCDRAQRVSVIVIVKQVRNDFGVCVRDKLIAFLHQLLFQLQVVFDNPVVHDRNASVSVQMRMSVHIRRLAVSRPSRMADPEYARHGTAAVSDLLEHFEASFRLRHIDLFSVKHSNAGRVVSSVFQL